MLAHFLFWYSDVWDCVRGCSSLVLLFLFLFLFLFPPPTPHPPPPYVTPSRLRQGRGHLILADFEQKFTGKIRDLPVERLAALSGPSLEKLQGLCMGGIKRMNRKTCEMAFQAWLGFYNSNTKTTGWSKSELVAEANNWYYSLGFSEPPALQAKTVGKMGLKGTPGLRVEGKGHGGGGGGRGGGGRGGGYGGGGGGGRGGGGARLSRARRWGA